MKGIRAGKLVVDDADAVDEQRVRLFQSQSIQGRVGTILRGHGHQGRLPSFFGFEMEGFGQSDFEIHVGIVWKLARGITDEGHAYLGHDIVHLERDIRSFLLIQLSYLDGQPFQRTSTLSFFRLTTESMRNKSSSVTATF